MGYILIAVAASLTIGPIPAQPIAQSLAQRHFADEASCQRAADAALSAPGVKIVCVAAEDRPVLQAAY